MTINIKIPSISKKIYDDDVIKLINNNYNEIFSIWTKHQLAWVSSAYATFKDHEKFLIVVYLVKKTLDFYSQNFTKISFENFYAKDQIEIEKFNIIDISKDLNMPKETARRKILQLENDGAIKRIKKKLILDRSVFPSVKPTNSIKKTSFFLANFFKILKKNKIIDESFESNFISDYIYKDFSHAWKLYYEMQIPIIINWKKQFDDIESWNIWGICVIDKSFGIEHKKNLLSRTEYLNTIFINNKSHGVNAMTISNITGIPRATVVRKLKKLLAKNYLSIDKKKLYHLSNNNLDLIYDAQKKNQSLMASFVVEIYNQMIFSMEKNNYEIPYYLKTF